jgi:hypothetical protein
MDKGAVLGVRPGILSLSSLITYITLCFSLSLSISFLIYKSVIMILAIIPKNILWSN